MKIAKAVVTAASRKQRALPLQTLIDSDGEEKAMLAIIVEEILRAGVDQVCIVVCPGDEAAYAAAADSYSNRLTFVQQHEPRGYGHAVYCAHAFTEGQPFLHLVGDHLYVSEGEVGCAQALVDVAQAQECAVSAVQASHESLLPYYGCVGGRRVGGAAGLYQVDAIAEKPTPTEAEQRLVVPGLRAGHYLCFFGMHVLTPTVMDILAARVRADDGAPITLTDALAELADRERYLAMESQGRRYDVGVKYGTFTAQLALALAGRDREQVLTRLLELVVRRTVDRGPA